MQILKLMQILYFQNYVHRSGRTARSNKAGLSVILISPQEENVFQRIMTNLKKGTSCFYFKLLQNLKFNLVSQQNSQTYDIKFHDYIKQILISKLSYLIDEGLLKVS